MNELTCNSICQLFCCPPVPSKIAAKLAFMPPTPSYHVSHENVNGDDKLIFSYASFLRDAFQQSVPRNIEVVTATTRRGSEIAVLYMKNNPRSQLTFLLSHGNAVDLGLMINFMYELGTKLNVNMMCYDYSGYGVSTGKPLEKNLYADSECAFNLLRTKFHVPLDKIVLYGQSIGTVPTVHLATLHRVAAVVLHSPLMSGLRVAFPRLKRNYCCDVFPNITRAPRIRSPTLIIHGIRDEVVHVKHGYRLCAALADHLLLDPLFIEGAGHNDCETFPQYLIRLIKLITVEIPELTTSAKSNNNETIETMASEVMPTASIAAQVYSYPVIVPYQSSEGDLSSDNTNSSHSSRTKLSPNNSLPSFEDLLSNGTGFCPLQTDLSLVPLLKTTGSSQAARCSTDYFTIDPPSIEMPPLLTNNELLDLCSNTTNIDLLLSSSTTCSKNEINAANEEPVNGGCNSNLSDTDDRYVDLILPPPPPPPPNGLPIPNELLWSVHESSKRTKGLTLPRVCVAQTIDAPQSKVATLPRPSCTASTTLTDCHTLTDSDILSATPSNAFSTPPEQPPMESVHSSSTSVCSTTALTTPGPVSNAYSIIEMAS